MNRPPGGTVRRYSTDLTSSTAVQRGRVALQAFSSIGKVVAAGGLACWVLAVITGWREFAVLAGTCLVLVVVAAASTLGKDSLDVTLALAQHRVVVGEAAVGTIVARNASTVRATSRVMEVPVGRGAAVLAVPGLAGGAIHEDVFVIPADRRAVLEVGPAKTVRGDALGLARREVVWTSSTQLFVHPRTIKLPGAASGWIKDMDGQSRNDLSSSDVVFHTLREYVPGDDQRHIHWKTFARTGDLMVRQFVDTRKSQLAMVLSCKPREFHDADEYELAVSVIASLGVSAIREQQELICISGRSVLPAFSEQRLLDGLAGVDLGDDEPDVIDTVQHAKARIRRSSVVLVVSGGRVNPAVLRAAADRCGAHARVIAVQVDAGSAPRSRHIGMHTLLTVGSLEDLQRLTRTLAA